MAKASTQWSQEQQYEMANVGQPVSRGVPPPQYPPWPPQQQTAPWAPAPSSQQMTTNNIIITTQPGVTVPTRPPVRIWSSGLCGCFSDIPSCLLAMLCPFILECLIASDMGEPCCSICGLVFCIPNTLFALRVLMRGKENISGSLLDDWLLTNGCCSCCYCCALAQLAREVKHVKNLRGGV